MVGEVLHWCILRTDEVLCGGASCAASELLRRRRRKREKEKKSRTNHEIDKERERAREKER